MPDKLIIGAGLYGIYSALLCARRAESVLVLERDTYAFKRATYINQARIHMGYHYPRSISTALKSRKYFDRFCKDYSFCVHNTFEQIYATSASFSWTNAKQFRKFCQNARIPCNDVPVDNYFNDGMCDGAFLTQEYTYDAQLLKEYLLSELQQFHNTEIIYNAVIVKIENIGGYYRVLLDSGEFFETPYILNSTYAGVNEIHKMIKVEPFKIKYELCEIILCRVNGKLKNMGITVMDGPFFSIMPFGKTEFHSLTSVTFTPHITSYDTIPQFDCQSKNGALCSDGRIGNCNDCPCKPESAWPYMKKLARKYLKDEYGFEYAGSLFSVKPILKVSEIDDSRPTVIREYSRNPAFVSVLSGKINTVYDLDEVL